jgi:PadR family transcriptional regulator, regulatory protein PadR
LPAIATLNLPQKWEVSAQRFGRHFAYTPDSVRSSDLLQNLALSNYESGRYDVNIATLFDTFNFFAILELMTDRTYLGEFELMLILAVIHLGDEAYGVPITRQLELHRKRNVSVGSVYAALERLEAKGLVVSSLGDPTPERGGKAKRYFVATKEGLRQVRETRRVLTNLWRAIPELKLDLPRES